jgi:hypothetical protein
MFTLILMLAAGMIGGIIATARRGGSSTSDKEVAELRERVSRLEQTIDAMSGEMDRVSEGQRFLTALLEERARGQALKPPASGPGDV